MEEKRIIEIGGVKMEVDLRYAKAIDTYHIGDNVKLLKKRYGDSYETHPAVIVGFDNFVERPAILVAYFEGGYEPKINFETITKDTKDVEICPMVLDEIPFTREEAVSWFDEAIKRKENEIGELQLKKEYFLSCFGKVFAEKEK